MLILSGNLIGVSIIHLMLLGHVECLDYRLFRGNEPFVGVENMLFGHKPCM